MPRNNRLRPLIAALVVLVALLIAWQAVVYFQHRGKIGIKVVVLPADSSLKIDNKPAKPGKIYLTGGVHQFVASRIYFDSDVKSINTTDITKDETIYMLPAANSPAAKAYLMQHPDIQQQREAAGGAEAEQIRTLLLSKYPFLTKLPVENSDYKIDYSLNSDNNIELTINLFGSITSPNGYAAYQQELKDHKSKAIQFLKDNNINSQDYKITYIPNI